MAGMLFAGCEPVGKSPEPAPPQKQPAVAAAVPSASPAAPQPKPKAPQPEPSPEAATRPAPTAARVVNIEALSPEERLAVLAMQGIANRKGPRVFLQTGQAVRWNQIDYDRDDKDKGGRSWDEKVAADLRSKYSNTCDYWIEYCTRIGMASFTPATPVELYRELEPELKGAILYGKLDDDLVIAGTMAGLKDAIPMTEEIHKSLSVALGREIPVVVDVRSLYNDYDPNSDRRIEAHKWAIKNLLPECDRSAALSRDKTYKQDAHDILIDCDLAIQNRWIIFDLSYMSEETRLGKGDKPDPVWGFEPPDKPLLIEIIKSLEQPFPPVYGWGRPYESALIRRLAINSAVKICTGNGNASFFRSMPVQTKSFKQVAPQTGDLPLENKIYVAFASNEGDTLKFLSSLANGGTWLQPQRGTIPINWGMDPLLYEKFPGLVSHYYNTATPNDYFFSAPSGWGYLAPMMLSQKQIPIYGSLVKKGGELADLHYIDVWWMGGLRNRGLFFPFLSAMGMRGLTQWSDRQEVEYAPDGTPIIHSNLYYARFRPEVLAAKIRTVGDQMGAPWFVFVYGGSPKYFSEIAKNLPQDRFKVVKLDEFFEAARKARPQVQGKSFRVGKDDITEAP